jgi:hypothetical protein
MTVQPTEQCVHTLFLISVFASVDEEAAASTDRGVIENAAKPPTARPVERKNVLRSIL